MLLQTLRRAGDSLVMTVPKAFVEQNGLREGSQVELHFAGRRLTLEALRRRRYTSVGLLAEMPEGLPPVEGWDEMSPVGRETG